MKAYYKYNTNVPVLIVHTIEKQHCNTFYTTTCKLHTLD